MKSDSQRRKDDLLDDLIGMDDPDPPRIVHAYGRDWRVIAPPRWPDRSWYEKGWHHG